MYQDVNVEHLPVIESIEAVTGFNFSPDIIWIFDLDRHGFWWGNTNALTFWGLSEVQQLIDKDLSDDTEGARKRTEQTFVKAALEGLTQDPWTTYPNGKPKVMLMRHVAVLLGPGKHRGIIAFISEQIDANTQPENLLFAEAVRYTTVAVSCYNMEGKRLFENPTFTQWYGNEQGQNGCCDFSCRFKELEQGQQRLSLAKKQQDGCFEHIMKTKAGCRRHNVDIRTSRHPLTGEYVFLVTEYDVTELYDTINELKATKEELKMLAHFDPLTKLPSVWLAKEKLKSALVRAQRDKKLVGLMFIDLDGFKSVNDNFGHGAGDQLLTIVAQRLLQIFRASDTVGRIGGDEFLVCLPNLNDQQDALMLADKAIKELEKQYNVLDDNGSAQQAFISASIGISFNVDSQHDAEALIRIADKKMYQAKRTGKNQFSY